MQNKEKNLVGAKVVCQMKPHHLYVLNKETGALEDKEDCVVIQLFLSCTTASLSLSDNSF